MAIHDFKCPECNKIVKDLFLKLCEIENHIEGCPKCGAQMEQSFHETVPRKPFKAYMDVHMSEDGPIEITSERQRQKELKKHGLDYFPYGAGNPGCEV